MFNIITNLQNNPDPKAEFAYEIFVLLTSYGVLLLLFSSSLCISGHHKKILMVYDKSKFVNEDYVDEREGWIDCEEE